MRKSAKQKRQEAEQALRAMRCLFMIHPISASIDASTERVQHERRRRARA